MTLTKRKPTRQPSPPPGLGPTREAMRHGDYVQGDSGKQAVWTNRTPDMIAKLRGYGTISGRQHQAGLAFRKTWQYVNGSPSPARDSTIQRVGGTDHETEAQAERMARARARLTTIKQRVGIAGYVTLVDVCVFDFSLGKARDNPELYAVLFMALEQAAIAYGITDG